MNDWMSETQCYFWHFSGCSLHVAVNVSLCSFVILRIVYLFLFNQVIYVSDDLIVNSVKILTIIVSLGVLGSVYMVKVNIKILKLMSSTS